MSCDAGEPPSLLYKTKIGHFVFVSNKFVDYGSFVEARERLPSGFEVAMKLAKLFEQPYRDIEDLT